jgi:hypothetical protein
VLGFGDGLVDRFSQLLNEFSQLCVQGVSVSSLPPTGLEPLELFFTLLLMLEEGNRNQPDC